MTIVYLGIAWLIGVWLGAATEGPLWFWLSLGVICLVLAVFFRKRTTHRLWLLLMAFICLGSGRTILSLPQIDPGHVAFYNGQEVTLTGLVNQEPDVYDRYLGLQVKAEVMAGPGEENQPVTGLVRVIAPRYPLIDYGTRVKISGILENPGNPAAASQREYLARQGIFSQMSPDSISVLEEGQGNPLRRGILAVKSRARVTIQHMLPDPEAALRPASFWAMTAACRPNWKRSFASPV